MIKRITEIQNIGPFANFRGGGSIGFEKLTFIYGLNTRGKTTLTSIFESLMDNNASTILDRKSIPESGNPVVKMSCRISDPSDTPINFRNSAWDNSEYGRRVEIFSTDFIHQNLFTGLQIERSNKENFTTFILGSEGVELAKQISALKSSIRSEKADLTSKVPLYVQNNQEVDLDDFLALNIDEDTSRQISELERNKIQELEDERTRLRRPQQILTLPTLNEISQYEINVEELVERTNRFLQESFDGLSSEGVEKLNSHITKTFRNSTNNDAKGWIRGGLDLMKEEKEECAFCGQSLESVQDLMSVYDEFFSEEYRAYLARINSIAADLKNQWSELSYDYNEEVQNCINGLERYRNLLSNEELDLKKAGIDSASRGLNDLNINALFLSIKALVSDKIDQKTRSPLDSVPRIDTRELAEKDIVFREHVTELNTIIKTLNIMIEAFKNGYRETSQIEERIRLLQTQLSEIQKKKARVDESQLCDEITALKAQITQKETELATKEQQLSEGQSAYLDEFFDKINTHFQSLGSRNFTLERKSNRRGDTPVYFLGVKFKGQEIEERNFHKVFSESDKRALALSIFCARLDSLEGTDLDNKVIILDDPVTSFDDNRIINSINLFKSYTNSVAQLIVLTHYPHFIKRYCQRGMNDTLNPIFIEIKRDASTSFLETVNEKKFTQSMYEEKFSKIMKFIEGNGSIDIRSDLRTFLESQYLPTFFAKKLRAASQAGETLSTLADKIDWIFDDDESTKEIFHELRRTTNPEAHIFTENNEEDIRNFANEFMDKLYAFNFSND